MGLKRTKLTKKLVESLVSSDQTYTLWDHEIPGFGVRVMTSGHKSFVLKCLVNRQQRWMTLGRFGDITLEEARKMATSKRGDIAKGIDPTQENRAMRTAPTVKELIDRFIEQHVVPKTRETTARGYIRYLRTVIEPRLGRLLVRAVTPAEVSKFHHDLRETPRQANQAVAILRKMFHEAEIWGYRPISSNPCVLVQKNPESKRERYLSTQELAVLGEVLAKAESEEFIPLQAVTALRLLIFTGARHGEILQLRWDQVDPERKLLIFGAEQHKTGRKSGTKTLPLNGPAFELLKATPRVLGNPHVIPGLKPGSHFIGLQKCWERVRDKVDEIEAERVEKKERVPGEVVSIQDVRIHDLRHTFASVGVSHGLSLPVMGSLLGHSQPSMTQRYAHLADDPRSEASEQVGERLAEALGKGKSAG